MAFGDEGYTLLNREWGISKSGRTVWAYVSPPGHGRGGPVTLPLLAIARFDERGTATMRFSGNHATVDADSWLGLIRGDDSQTLSLTDAEGRKIVLPGIALSR